MYPKHVSVKQGKLSQCADMDGCLRICLCRWVDTDGQIIGLVLLAGLVFFFLDSLVGYHKIQR